MRNNLFSLLLFKKILTALVARDFEVSLQTCAVRSREQLIYKKYNFRGKIIRNIATRSNFLEPHR